MWNVEAYSRYSDERSRPFVELIQRIPAIPVSQIFDLGCGTGQLTRTLLQKWPAAQITGIDSSPEMLAKAVEHSIPGRLEFLETTIEKWAPSEPVDLIISNAAFHWVGDHENLFKRLSTYLKSTGTLAVQMPNRFQSISQQIIDEVCNDSRWSSVLTGVGLNKSSVLPSADYIELLHKMGFTVDSWETTYFHMLQGTDPVLRWMQGTALRPLIACLPPKLAIEFQDALRVRFSKAYPERDGITIFPMPRLFLVASRGTSTNSRNRAVDRDG